MDHNHFHIKTEFITEFNRISSADIEVIQTINEDNKSYYLWFFVRNNKQYIDDVNKIIIENHKETTIERFKKIKSYFSESVCEINVLQTLIQNSDDSYDLFEYQFCSVNTIDTDGNNCNYYIRFNTDFTYTYFKYATLVNGGDTLEIRKSNTNDGVYNTVVAKMKPVDLEEWEFNNVKKYLINEYFNN